MPTFSQQIRCASFRTIRVVGKIVYSDAYKYDKSSYEIASRHIEYKETMLLLTRKHIYSHRYCYLRGQNVGD